MPNVPNPKDPRYDPMRPQDTESYVHYGGTRCTNCSSAKGKPGEQCQNFRKSLNARCDGTIFIECGDYAYRYVGSSLRRHAPIGHCTFAQGHSGECSWKLSGQKCVRCHGSGKLNIPEQTNWKLLSGDDSAFFAASRENQIVPAHDVSCPNCSGTGRMP